MVSFVSGFVLNGRSNTASDSSVGWSITCMRQSVGIPSPSGVFCFSFDPEGVEVIVRGKLVLMSRSDHHVRSRSGFSGFGDLRQDYEDGFRRGVVPKEEIGHVRRHVTNEMTSKDYTSQT